MLFSDMIIKRVKLYQRNKCCRLWIWQSNISCCYSRPLDWCSNSCWSRRNCFWI